MHSSLVTAGVVHPLICSCYLSVHQVLAECWGHTVPLLMEGARGDAAGPASEGRRGSRQRDPQEQRLAMEAGWCGVRGGWKAGLAAAGRGRQRVAESRPEREQGQLGGPSGMWALYSLPGSPRRVFRRGPGPSVIGDPAQRGQSGRIRWGRPGEGDRAPAVQGPGEGAPTRLLGESVGPGPDARRCWGL